MLSIVLSISPSAETEAIRASLREGQTGESPR
jgi:hypothetical protein